MSKICPLFSGSDGNSTLISSGGTHVLVDAGVSFKKIAAALSENELSPSDISAVFITHEHTDHISGLKTFLKKTDALLCASADTLDTLAQKAIIPEGARVESIEDGKVIRNINITRFATSHDCVGSSGYVIETSEGLKAAVCTDLGYVSEEVKASLLGCDTVLIESNHDVTMLQKGPYPPELKMRILSDKGHISNNTCAALLPDLLKSGTKRIILGHISKNNNIPMLALNTARNSLMSIGAKENEDYILCAAKPQDNGVIFF